ncbi:Cse1-domain-containing protein [Imleria badia]|nr:Cse1-domain-containing protein [Imleria badia]
MALPRPSPTLSPSSPTGPPNDILASFRGSAPAVLECWVDPHTIPSHKALGTNLQRQFEGLSLRIPYRPIIDPSYEDLRRFCLNLRKQTKDETVCFDRNYTQYIPISLMEVQSWLGSPGGYIWNCSAAGNLLTTLLNAATWRLEPLVSAMSMHVSRLSFRNNRGASRRASDARLLRWEISSTSNSTPINSPSRPPSNMLSSVWQLTGSNNLPNVADDNLVSQALRFISTAIRSGYYKLLFSSRDVISSLAQGVGGAGRGVGGIGKASTRRQAAADVLQALVGSGYRTETTVIVGTWIQTGLEAYGRDARANWTAKDSAVYLLVAIATEASTMQHGVTLINSQVDVVKFFSDHVFQDLQATHGTVHPILQVDAIRFLLTFRNQLTKEQLLAALPLLINYVAYTYAAITIDRILFAQTNVHDFASDLLNAVLAKIEGAGTPEKVAENDHLMKCTMRVIVTACQTLTPVYLQILQCLIVILGAISKNPNNPNFDQYIFESIAALMRFVVHGTPATSATFEHTLFGPFTIILQQDIDQYIPYVFQILAQMLLLHTTGVPTEYPALLPFLLTPACWKQKGSILVGAGVGDYEDERRMGVPLVGGHDAIRGSDVAQVVHAPVGDDPANADANEQDGQIRVPFHVFPLAHGGDRRGGDGSGLYNFDGGRDSTPQILTGFVIPQVPKMPHKDRKVVAVALTESRAMLSEPASRSWLAVFTALIKLLREWEEPRRMYRWNF